MGLLRVECLSCGTCREIVLSAARHAQPECPRCGYLGWAPAESLTEQDRRALRTPPEQRRLKPA